MPVQFICSLYICSFQIISPHDKGISSKILANLEPWPLSWDTSITEKSPDCKDPYDEIYSCYMEDLKKLSFQKQELTYCLHCCMPCTCDFANRCSNAQTLPSGVSSKMHNNYFMISGFCVRHFIELLLYACLIVWLV